MKKLSDLLKEKKSNAEPVLPYWQERALFWVKEWKLDPKSTQILFRYFKKDHNYFERLCVAASECNARNPIAYMLAIMKNERKKTNAKTAEVL